jgi:hypothetical protein
MDVECLMPGLKHVPVCRRRPDLIDAFVEAGVASRARLETNPPFEIVCDLCGARFSRRGWRSTDAAAA